MVKTRRVTITELARITGRSESTWRKWLREPDCRISVNEGGFRGGTREQRGRVRLIDLEDALTLHRARGGDAPNESYLPEQTLERLEAELIGLRRRLQELEEVVRVGGVTPPIIATSERVAHRPRALRRVSETRETRETHDTSHLLRAEVFTQDLTTNDSDVNDSEMARRAGYELHRQRGSSHLPLLPPGLIGMMEFMRQHGARETQISTFRKAIQTGRLPARSGNWLMREQVVPVTWALDRSARQRAWELWRASAWFQRCPYCPHTVEREVGAPYTDAADASAAQGE